MTVEILYKKIEALDIQKAAIDSVRETIDPLLDLNLMQMNAGLRADGSDITPDYTDATVEIKIMKGQPYDHVTLRDKGNFQAETYAEIKGSKVVIDSKDPKSEKLQKKYSKAKGSIFGLSEKYKAEYIRENLRPVFEKKIFDLTGLKFK